jgi:hypothetical protein
MEFYHSEFLCNMRLAELFHRNLRLQSIMTARLFLIIKLFRLHPFKLFLKSQGSKIQDNIVT